MKIHYSLIIATFIGLILFSSGLFYIDFNESGIVTETHNAYTSDGVKITFDVFYNQKDGVEKPIAITIHGFSGNRKTMKIIALNLAKNGFLVASLDLRGHGDSEGYMPPLSTSSEERKLLYKTFEKDVYAVLDWLRDNNYGLLNSLTLIGHSMGGGLAIYLGGRIASVRATIAIAPGLSSEFVNVTSPRNLLLIAGAYDKIIPPSSVLDLFYKSINGTGEPDLIYEVDGNFRKLYVDNDSDHISIIYDSDVIKETLKWAKSMAFGGIKVETIEPYTITIPSNLSAIGGIVLIVCITVLISIGWNVSKKEVRIIEEKLIRRLIPIIFPFISTLVLNWILSILSFMLINLVSPLLMANLTVSFLLGNGLGVLIGGKICEKLGLCQFGILDTLKDEFKGEKFWLSLRLGLIYSVLLIMIFYGTIGLNILSTFSTSWTHLSYLPIIWVATLISVINLEYYFRRIVKNKVYIGNSTPLLSGLLSFAMFYVFLLSNAMVVSLIIHVNFWFFVIGLKLLWLPILALIALGEVIDEYFNLIIPQIMASSVLLSTILLAITPAII